MLLSAYPVEHTGYVFHLKYCGKREYQCGDDIVYVKTETKPFTQNGHFAHFLEGHLSALHSHLAKESQICRKPFKMIVSSTLKNMSQIVMTGQVSPHSTASHVFSKVTLLFVLCFCIKLCIYMMLFVSKSLSNLIIYG